MAHLSLALLGTFLATLNDLPAEGLNSSRLRALLAYLAVERGREHPRFRLAALLWPERPDTEALSSLRYALSNLHAALGDRRTPTPFLLVTRTSVQFNPGSDHWLDIAEFQDLRGRSDAEGLERALSLYRGPFLDGLSVGDSAAFEDWMLLKGEEYRQGAMSVLGQLVSLQMERGAYDKAAHWARRQLELEPYREQTHRQLMLALALGGERSAALVHYGAYRRLLALELGCEPEDETMALRAQILEDHLPRPQSSPAVQVASSAQAPPIADSRSLRRVVAREQELARLRMLLDHALAGEGGVALIAGEAGAGKTALLDEFARRVSEAHADLIALRGRCNAYAGAGDPYLPFREMLQTLSGDVEGRRAGGSLSREQARRVWEALPVVGRALVEHGPDLIDSFVQGEALLRRAEAFSGPLGAARWQARLRELVLHGQEGAAHVPGTGLGALAPPPDLFAQVTQVLHAVSESMPLLLAIDDLHWADGGTVALLFHLGRCLPGSRILLACAYRPEALQDPVDSNGLGSPLGLVLQELTREWGEILVDLDQADGRAFVEAYVDGEPNRLGVTFRQALYDHTGGNPLFTVELLRNFEREGVLVQDEAGRWVEAARLDWERWPPQVEAVIAAHLAALAEEDRALLQASSVQGERFIAEVAARVLGWDEDAVVRRLSGPLRARHRLVEAVSLDRLASSGQRLSRYHFRHWLVQRSAYRALDAVERARLHEATGRALEAICAVEAGQSQALAPELAGHYEAAGLPLEAARYRLEAGQWAVRLAAYDEAIAHLERGLSLLEDLAVSGERRRLELALCSALVNPAQIWGGWQAPVRTRALERLSNLSRHPDLRNDPQRLTALTVLSLASTWSGDPERGQRVGEQIMGLVPDGDRQSLMLAHWVQGHSRWLLGHLTAAREHLEQALALYDLGADRRLGPLLGGDPAVIGRTVLGFIVWLLGYPDQGRGDLQQALAQAQSIEQPSSTAFAHLWAGVLTLILGRDATAALSHVQALRPLGQAGQVYSAWVELLAGQMGVAGPEPRPEQDLTEAVKLRSAFQAVGSGVGHAAQLLVQAQVLMRSGQVRLALEAVEQALVWIEDTSMRVMEAEVWRMRGELLLADRPDRDDEAKACFHRALDLARDQLARWLELRATASLARLWQAQGRRDEARELLSDIYGWFTEGFDTLDLVEAKALLEELA